MKRFVIVIFGHVNKIALVGHLGASSRVTLRSEMEKLLNYSLRLLFRLA